MEIKNIKILNGEPKFRMKQIYRAIYVDLIDDWTKATVLPVRLKNQLEIEAPLKIDHKIIKGQYIEKASIKLSDENVIESVLIKEGDRNRPTICVSSQVGCALGCAFCATGKLGFKRNLTKHEIVNQVLLFARILKKDDRLKRGINVVYMGMGEPFLNYKEVIDSIKIINDKEGLNIGARHISISTVGITEGIDKISKEKLQINLAISLHASNDKDRSKIIKVNSKYPIDKIFISSDRYIQKTNRKVMLEYLMIKDLNDNIENAHELSRLIKNPLYVVNLIPYNETGKFKPSSKNKINHFKNILERHRIKVSIRKSYGRDAWAACGQLANKK